MFEYTQFSIKVHYYNKRGLKICLICYKLFRCSENYELQRWQLLQPSNILLKSRFRICNLKLYKLVDHELNFNVKSWEQPTVNVV